MGLSEKESSYLVDLYGTQTDQIIAIRNQRDDQSILLAEVQFSIEKEMTLSLTDFFIYRTGRMFFDVDSVKGQMHFVANEMKQALDWSERKLSSEIEILTGHLNSATSFS